MHLFIPGFPRCGTTSLFRYLSDHPEINPTSQVEGCYLIDDDYFSSKYLQSKFPRYSQYGLDGYYKIFSEKTDFSIYLDGSPDYVYQEVFKSALGEIDDFRLIFLLRDPVERIYSFYQFSKGKHARIPASMSFTKFIDIIQSGDDRFSDYVNLQNIIEHSKYVNHLNKLTEYSDKFLLINYEDFISDPQKTIYRICDSIGISSSFFDDYTFEKHNSSSSLRYQWIQRLYNNLIPNSIKMNESGLKVFLRDIYKKLNYKGKESKTEQDKLTIDKLRKQFEVHNQELSSTYGVNISSWK